MRSRTDLKPGAGGKMSGAPRGRSGVDGGDARRGVPNSRWCAGTVTRIEPPGRVIRARAASEPASSSQCSRTSSAATRSKVRSANGSVSGSRPERTSVAGWRSVAHVAASSNGSNALTTPRSSSRPRLPPVPQPASRIRGRSGRAIRSSIAPITARRPTNHQWRSSCAAMSAYAARSIDAPCPPRMSSHRTVRAGQERPMPQRSCRARPPRRSFAPPAPPARAGRTPRGPRASCPRRPASPGRPRSAAASAARSGRPRPRRGPPRPAAGASATGRYQPTVVKVALPAPLASARRRSVQRAQADGSSTYETAAIATVAPIAIASDRHSRRTRNQRTPTPGVTFVRNISAQAAGQRKPTTIATA